LVLVDEDVTERLTADVRPVHTDAASCFGPHEGLLGVVARKLVNMTHVSVLIAT
jgi:hypothetical protein